MTALLRRWSDDFREFPATMGLCALWVLVFALMVLDQWLRGSVPTLGKLILGMTGGHAFGELTIRDFFQGEVWLPLTATFVHYGLLHIGLNLFIMYHLGALIESWYGPWQFLAVYVVIGYGGNLLSVLARHALGADPMLASGGGSTVVLGLAALCAVVGWRSRTRIGAAIQSQMVGLLIATALLGFLVPIIDNWGHAGGALMGAAVGFGHRVLIRTVRHPLAKLAGFIGLILLIAAGAAQVSADRIESARRQRIESTRRQRMAQWESKIKAAQQHLVTTHREIWTLEQVWAFYQFGVSWSELEYASFIPKSLLRRPEANSEAVVNDKAKPEAKVQPQKRTLLPSELPEESVNAMQTRALGQLDSLRGSLGEGPTADDYRQARILLENVLRRPPTPIKNRAFQDHLNALLNRARANQQSARARLDTLVKQARATMKNTKSS